MTKKTRKELLKKEDIFLTSAGQAATWLQQNRIKVIATVAGAAVLVAAIWAGIAAVRGRARDASRLLSEGQQIVRADVVAPDGGGAEQANPSANPPTFASAEDRAKAALEKFERAVDAGGSGGAALLARFYIASLKQELGDTDAARTLLEELLGDLSPSDRLYFLAAERLAYIKEAAGDHEGAMAALKPLLPVGEGSSDPRFFGDFAAYHTARLHEATGNPEQARATYRKLMGDFPTSSLLPDVEQRLRALGPGLGDTGATEAAPSGIAAAQTPPPAAASAAASAAVSAAASAAVSAAASAPAMPTGETTATTGMENSAK